MDMQVAKKKLGLKERYALMTRGLDWVPSYQKMEDIYPYIAYEGIKIHDWDKWEDPFRLTMDAYWKYQSEKERKLYAVLDAFNQNNGHLNVTDARYINTVKLFVSGISPSNTWHTAVSPTRAPVPGPRAAVACLMQSLDEIRHAQTQVHTVANYNKYYNGMHDFHHAHDRVCGSCRCPRVSSTTPSPPAVRVHGVDRLRSSTCSPTCCSCLSFPGAAYNGDMGTMTFGFSAQSDEARHMTLGLEVIKFILEQDPDNVPIVQRWIDKWTWRGYRVLTLVAMMMDYMLPKRTMSWKEAWRSISRKTVAPCSRIWPATASPCPSAPSRSRSRRTTCRTRPGAPSTTTRRPPTSTPGCRTKTKWRGCRPNIRTATTSTTAAHTSSGANRPPRATASTTRRCPCCARPARSR